MGKKKNKKFKKIKHHVEPAKVVNSLEDSSETKPDITSVNTEIAARKDPYDVAEYAHVQKDVKKILIIMISIVVLLFIIYYVSTATSVLTTMGDWLYRVLNIKAI